MGFADILAQAGRGTAIGRVGEVFGGQTDASRQEAQLQQFIASDLPRYAQAINAETDPQKIGMIGQEFLSAAAKSGMPLPAIEKVMGMLVEPARANLNRQTAGQEYGQMADELTPRMEGRPEGVEGPVNASGAFLERPGRAFHQGDAARTAAIAARTGINPPPNLAGLLQAPSVVEENQGQAAAANALAGRHKTEENLKRLQTEILQNLPDEDVGGTGVSPRALGLGTEGRGLTDLRKLMPDPLEGARRGLIQAQTGAAGASAEASRALAERRRRIEETGGGGGSVTETVTDQTPDALDIELILKKAQEAGINTPEELQAFAARYGYEVEGSPEIAPGRKFLGIGTDPTIGGNFSLKPKPKTSTRTTTKGGQQAKGKPLDEATAVKIFEQAGRDPKKAAAMARQMGYQVD